MEKLDLDELSDSEHEGTMANDNSSMKVVASFLAGVVLTGLGAFMGYPHDLPTKSDLIQAQVQTQKQLDEFQAQQTLEQTEITTLRVNLAKIMYKFNIPEVVQ